MQRDERKTKIYLVSTRIGRITIELIDNYRICNVFHHHIFESYCFDIARSSLCPQINQGGNDTQALMLETWRTIPKGIKRMMQKLMKKSKIDSNSKIIQGMRIGNDIFIYYKQHYLPSLDPDPITCVPYKSTIQDHFCDNASWIIFAKTSNAAIANSISYN